MKMILNGISFLIDYEVIFIGMFILCIWCEKQFDFKDNVYWRATLNNIINIAHTIFVKEEKKEKEKNFPNTI